MQGIPSEIRSFISRLFGDYFFLFLLLAGIGVNYFFEVRALDRLREFNKRSARVVAQSKLAEDITGIERSLVLLEADVRQLGRRGDTTVLSRISSTKSQLDKDLVLLQDKLKQLVDTQTLRQFRQVAHRKIDYEMNLVNGAGSGTPAKLDVDRDLALEEELHNLAGNLRLGIRMKVDTMEQELEREKMRVMSGHYAMTHLISFIFLVIAGFIIYKILQGNKLNMHLREAVASEKKAQEVKDQFMDNMTHELRSPMNAVLGYTNLLQRTRLDQEQERYVRSIKTSGELLLNVINEVLDFSKVKSGYVHFSKEPFNLREQFSALSEIMRGRFLEKGLHYQCLVDGDVPEEVVGDASKLLQVLINLTSNALKFTPSGKVTVRVTVKSIEHGKCVLAMYVQDTGVGIPTDKLTKIFDRFYQVESGSGKTHPGTGLGLSITREILALQGGSIRVESEVGKGSTFFVELPFNLVAPLESSGEQTETFKGQLPAGLKVLVVDDNNMSRELTAFMLGDLDVKYTLVYSGAEALTVLQKERYDIVLLDLQMPGMDGWETAERIRKELQLDIPIVALSAFAEQKEKQRCMDIGMDAYLTKPVNEKDLFETLEMFAPLPDPSRVDIAYLTKVSKGNAEFIENVILKVADSLPREIQALRQAIFENDQQRVNELAHDMKTTFAILGMTQAAADPLKFLESWKVSPVNVVKAARMLEEVEAISTDAVEQIRANFGTQTSSVS